MVTIEFSASESMRVTQGDALALRAFGLIVWDDYMARGVIRACSDVKAATVQRFLRAFNA